MSTKGWIRVLASVTGALVASTAVAQVGEPPAVERGEMLYRLHCQACHGPDAAGDGPVAEHLRTPPADLRELARNAGGTFPADRVHRVVDGRDEVSVHGPREMPVWGLSLRELGLDTNQEADVAARIGDLVRYLETLQHSP